MWLPQSAWSTCLSEHGRSVVVVVRDRAPALAGQRSRRRRREFLGPSLSLAEARGREANPAIADLTLAPSRRKADPRERAWLQPGTCQPRTDRRRSYDGVDYALGESFIPRLEENIARHHDLIDLHIGDSRRCAWGSSPIDPNTGTRSRLAWQTTMRWPSRGSIREQALEQLQDTAVEFVDLVASRRGDSHRPPPGRRATMLPREVGSSVSITSGDIADGPTPLPDMGRDPRFAPGDETAGRSPTLRR